MSPSIQLQGPYKFPSENNLLGEFFNLVGILDINGAKIFSTSEVDTEAMKEITILEVVPIFF